MTGEEFKKQLKGDNVVLADIARELRISTQALNSKLGAKRLSVEFVEQVNKIVYKDVIKEKPPLTSENEIFRLRVELDLLKDTVKHLERDVWELQQDKLQPVTFKQRETKPVKANKH